MPKHSGPELPMASIVDVDVEGESLLNQRDEFATLIARAGGTISGPIRIIEARLSDGHNS
jgi:hypothetical protein